MTNDELCKLKMAVLNGGVPREPTEPRVNPLEPSWVMVRNLEKANRVQATRIAELEAALKPFSDEYERLGVDDHDRTISYTEMKYGDLCSAAQAYKENE